MITSIEIAKLLNKPHDEVARDLEHVINTEFFNARFEFTIDLMEDSVETRGAGFKSVTAKGKTTYTVSRAIAVCLATRYGFAATCRIGDALK